jgi:hypothetical protein
VNIIIDASDHVFDISIDDGLFRIIITCKPRDDDDHNLTFQTINVNIIIDASDHAFDISIDDETIQDHHLAFQWI